MQEADFAATQRITDVGVGGPSSSKRIQEQQPSSSSSNAPSKLEPFLLLAKSARGAGAAALIDQVTAAPGVYVFAELLDTKAMAEVNLAPLVTCGRRSGNICKNTRSCTALVSLLAARQRRRTARSEVATPEPIRLWESAGLQE